MSAAGSYIYEWQHQRKSRRHQGSRQRTGGSCCVGPRPIAAEEAGQLDLTVMVAFAPERVLEKEDGMAVVKLPGQERQRATLLWAALSRTRGILKDEDESYEVYVGEHLRDRWTALYGPGPGRLPAALASRGAEDRT